MIDTVKKVYSEDGNLDNYQVTYQDSSVVKSVPLDENNSDYQAIQEWVAEGNTIQEAD
jgi:hypothetical protein